MHLRTRGPSEWAGRLLLHADLATRLTLIATHLVAAGIVSPAVAGRLGTTGTRCE